MSNQLPASPEERSTTEDHDSLPAASPGADSESVLRRDPSIWVPKPPPEWRRYLRAVVRFKYLVLLTVILGIAAGVRLSQFIRPKYQVEAVFWVRVVSQYDVRDGPVRSSRLVTDVSWGDLLRSFMVLDDVVRKEKLYLRPGPGSEPFLGEFEVGEDVRPGSYTFKVDRYDPIFTLTDELGVVLQRDTLGKPVGADFGFKWTPAAEAISPGREISFQLQNPRSVAAGLSSSIRIKQDREASFMRASLVGGHPERAASLMNAIADRFIEVAAELSREHSRTLASIVEEQYRIAEGRLRQADAALEEFQVRMADLPSTTTGSSSSTLRLVDMQVEHERVGDDAEALARVLRQARDSTVSLAALEGIPSVAAAPHLLAALTELKSKQAELRALRLRYTDEFPSVRRLREEIRLLDQHIPSLLQALRSELIRKRDALASELARASERLRQIPPQEIEEARLQRRVKTAENIAAMLRERYEEARLAEVSALPDVRVLDYATPPRSPTNAKHGQMLIVLAGLGSMGLALMGVGFLDRNSPRLYEPGEVTGDLGLLMLGTVPHLRNGRRRRVARGVEALAVEAFRNVRLNVETAFGRAGPVVVAVSSPGTGDGKSFVASNLAISFVLRGLRTVLIDGDLRKGCLHDNFEGGRRSPGLTEYLAGEASDGSIIQEVGINGRRLEFIGCGRRLESAPELLQTRQMSDLFGQLRRGFDVVIVDTSPLAAGVDAFVMGALAGNLILVIRAGVTNPDLAQVKLMLMDRLPIRVLGTVLNDVPPRGVYRHYGYLEGYAIRSETAHGT